MPFWTDSHPLILASGSTARRQLLEQAGVVPLVHPASLDERALESRIPAPEDKARTLAEAKALAVSLEYPHHIVLGADQILVCEGFVLHKPTSQDEARRQLGFLSGQHQVLMSAACLVRDGVVLETLFETATLTMRTLSDEALDIYCRHVGDEVLSCVGGYQIEALGIHLFEAIKGSHAAILGLPMLPLLAALRRQGCLVP
jgi:septum formation protein